jgi:hypothetical protein
VGCPGDFFSSGKEVNDDDFRKSRTPQCAIQNFNPYPVPGYNSTFPFNLTSPDGILAMCQLACKTLAQLNETLWQVPQLKYAETPTLCSNTLADCTNANGNAFLAMTIVFSIPTGMALFYLCILSCCSGDNNSPFCGKLGYTDIELCEPRAPAAVAPGLQMPLLATGAAAGHDVELARAPATQERFDTSGKTGIGAPLPRENMQALVFEDATGRRYRLVPEDVTASSNTGGGGVGAAASVVDPSEQKQDQDIENGSSTAKPRSSSQDTDSSEDFDEPGL